MGNGVSQAVDKLFDERRDFIIIGLTGRTGAGCSTVAKILQTDCGHRAATIFIVSS